MNEATAGQTLRISTWELERIADTVGGRLTGADGAEGRRTPAAVSTDTRSIGEGELFVALRGENFDAHDFVDEAFGAGAAAAIVEQGWERPPGWSDDDRSHPVIEVADTHRALTNLGHAIWLEARDEGLHTINVTGSNGKTTTKELLSSIWSTVGKVHATPGNLNNDIGVPLTLCALPLECDHFICEMGANAGNEIAELIRMAPGAERIITSIGYAHTEGFGGLEGVRRAKSEIMEVADEHTTGIVPESEREALGVEAGFPGRILSFGPEEGADVRVLKYDLRVEQAAEVTLECQGEELRLPLGIPGRHNALNLAASLATMWARGVRPDREALADSLMGVDLPGGRWREVSHGDFHFVDDAYNANPTSMRAAARAFLEWAQRRAEERRCIVVIGSMHELGERSEELHAEVAADLADYDGLDAICAVGEYAEVMVEGVRRRDDAGAERAEIIAVESAEQAAAWTAEAGPAFVFLKASRAARLERIIDMFDQDSEDETD